MELSVDSKQARSRIEPYVERTPLVRVPELDGHAGRPVHLKLENHQVTGSFKVRGAACLMAGLDAAQRARGVVTCSSGNHGKAVAHVAARMGVQATICVPGWVDPTKLEAIRASGARAVLAGDTYDEAEIEAYRIEQDTGAVFVHPFDDPRIVAGQGTIAHEVLEELPELGAIAVPLSGGGLAGGIAAALARSAPHAVEVIAVSARAARVMYESLRVGGPVTLEEEETLATALSGGIGLDNRWSFGLVRGYVHRHVLVDEEQIAGAMSFAHAELGQVVEGGGAVGIAALLDGSLRATPGDASDGRPLVVVVSGGNVAPETLAGL